MGIDAALAAGMRCVFYNPHRMVTRRQAGLDAGLVDISDMQCLPEAITQLTGKRDL